MNNSIKIVSIILLLVCSWNVNAARQWGPTDAELRTLPPYCKAKLRKVSEAEKQVWKQRLGGGFGHIHHYCNALNFMRRASKSWNDKQNQQFNYNNARSDIEYMLNHTSPNYFMRPEFHVKLGEVLIQQGDGAKGAAEIKKAITQKVDYVPAYVALSNYYKRSGLMDMAREVLQQGLERVPNSKALKRRLKRLEK